MPDLIITPGSGKLEFVDSSAQVTRRHSFTLDANDGLTLDSPLSAAAISAPLNVINVTVNNSNANYPFVLAQSGETGAKNLLMDGAGGTYNPSTNTATIDISGNSATTTLASNSTNLGGVAAASYVTLTGTQTLTNKTITGTFTGNLTGTGSWATNAVNANTATNSTQLNGQAASYYQTALNGTGFVKISGTTISYDNSTYTPTSRTITAGTGISGGGDLSANRTIAVDDTVSRKYTSTINNVTSSAWTTVCNVVGDNLSSAIRATFNGTSNSVVVNVLADILVNHFQDIIVYAISGFYSKLTIRIITNNDASFTLQVKHDGGTSTNLAVEIFPLNTETITFNPGTLFSTTTFDHICEWGVSTSGNGGNNSDIRTAGIFYGAGTGLTGTATNLTAGTATNATQLNGQAASYYTNIPARLGYTPVNQAGDTISGNLTVNGNFAVNGSVTAFSASNIYITSSNLTVTDNILLMNALTPYQRYAGIQMYDSGSGTLSQFLWDGEGDYFFLTGSAVNGKIITGPDGQTNLTANYIPKATAGYKLGNSLIYDDGTNVGISTTVPSTKFHVYGNAEVGDSTADTGLIVRHGSGAAQYGRIRFYSTSTNINTIHSFPTAWNGGTLLNASAGAINLQGSNGITFGSWNNIDVAFAQGGNNYFKGYVGIGTSSPTYKLHVNGGSTEVGGQSAAAFEKQSSTDGRIAWFSNSTGSGYSSYIYIGSNPGRDWKIGKNVLNSGTTGHFQITNDLNQLRMQISAADDSITFPSSSVGIGTSSPSYKLDVGAAGNDVVSVRLTPGYERVRYYGFDLLGYNDGNLWMIGNNPTNTLVLGKTWDWDNQIGIAYTPGTVGNSGGILQIGQISKNNANYTHGITRLYTNGLERITIIANGNVGISTTLPTTPLHVVGVISGSSFSGAGTGLTGTASGLSIGGSAASCTGNAATATTASYANALNAANNYTAVQFITTGKLEAGGNVIAGGQFSGAGTGLTGTAASLTAGTANSVAWTNVSSRPTAVSAFTNDSLYQYHRTDITSLSSSATNLGQPLGTFDANNATNGPTNAWYNYLSSTHGGYLTSLIANRHRSSQWYVGYKEGPGGTPTNPTWYELLHSGNYSSFTNLTASWATNAVTALNVGNGTITIAAGTGVGVGTTNTFTTNQSGATTVTITNTGVTSNVAGTGISVSGATGAVTITNSGVTSAVAGTGVGVSGATGAVTFSIGQAVGTGNSPTFAAVTTSTDGANHIMAGTTNAEGIRMTPASSTTYPVFLRSINPGVGEASPWIYKEQATDWGIWHNNPVNSIDFTKQGSGGIASNVGGSSSNTVTVRVEMATGFVQTIAGYRNSAGTTILDNNGNITGNAATVTTNANLTGDVTSTGNATTIASNAVTTAKIANNNVTLAKIENITAYTILGNSNASAAATPAALSVGTVATMLSGQTMNIAGSSTSCTGNAATATTATTANALNTSNSYTVTNLIASGYLQSTVGYLRTDDGNGIEVLTTTNSAQAINVKGILIGSSYDTTAPQNEIRTSNNQSLVLNARGTGQIDLYTNDATKVTVLNGGNVGIGTSNPGRKLDVEGIVRTRGASGTGGFEISAATSGTAKWRIEWDSASDSLDFNWVG